MYIVTAFVDSKGSCSVFCFCHYDLDSRKIVRLNSEKKVVDLSFSFKMILQFIVNDFNSLELLAE